MLSVRLHGPRDLRVEEIPEPDSPGPGEVLLAVRAVGICGSDLHTYRDARIGDTLVQEPLILGHEFAGVVELAGPDAVDGLGQLLRPGIRVAVDPAQPCGRCEMCEDGNPNLCLHLHFCGHPPDNGALRERILVPARTCFPVPDQIDDAAAAMLEPLGVAIHAVNLSRLRVKDSVSIHGAGPIGLLLLQIAKLAGAEPLYVSENLPWRLWLAARLGATPIDQSGGPPAGQIHNKTQGRGVDVAFECGWAGTLVQEAAEAVRYGGRVVLVGIPEDDRLTLKHSTARRKGLTLVVSRRMKHTFPWAMELVERGRVDVQSLISHRYPLARAPEAFALNEKYQNEVVKVIVEVGSGHP